MRINEAFKSQKKNKNELLSIVDSSTHLRTGLWTAKGVAIPILFILCCIVGVAADPVRFAVPILGCIGFG